MSDAESKSQTDVIAAFCRGERAGIPTFRSDGRRLFSGEAVIAQWQADGINITPCQADVSAETHKILLRAFMRRAKERNQFVRRLLLYGKSVGAGPCI